jgi:hypothetical protein
MLDRALGLRGEGRESASSFRQGRLGFRSGSMGNLLQWSTGLVLALFAAMKPPEEQA